MKIQNVSKTNNSPATVSFLLRKRNGTDELITLAPGEFVYSQTDTVDMNLRIYERKNMLKVTKDNKPEELNYHVVYSGNLVVKNEIKIEKIVYPAKEEEEQEIEELQESDSNSATEEVEGLEDGVNSEDIDNIPPIDFEKLKDVSNAVQEKNNTKSSIKKETDPKRKDRKRGKPKKKSKTKKDSLAEAKKNAVKYINADKK